MPSGPMGTCWATDTWGVVWEAGSWGASLGTVAAYLDDDAFFTVLGEPLFLTVR